MVKMHLISISLLTLLILPLIAHSTVNKSKVATAWIVRHSAGIDGATAEKIVEEAFKMPNSILLISLMKVESSFNPKAVSKKGAIGLGQVRYEVHKEGLSKVGIKQESDLFDIECNIKASSFILQDMLRRSKGNVRKALYYYVGGKESRYVARIFSNYVQLSIEVENEVPKM